MKRFANVLITAALLLSTVAFAQGPKIHQFSSDMTIKSRQGDTMPGKFYMGDRKTRIEITAHDMPMVMISDMAAKKTYILFVSQKMVMERDINAKAPEGRQGGMMPQAPRLQPECDPDHFTCKDAGMEMVNGRNCHKWVYTAKDAGNEAANSTQWIDESIMAPVRVVNGDGSQMDFTNIKEGTQDASLFKPPSDYQPFNPMGMMGGRRPH